MNATVSIDGVLVPAGEARVPVFDRGFLYGDSVYEVVRTYDLEPFELGPHLARLAASAERIALRLPWGEERMEREIRRVVQSSADEATPDPAAAPWNVGERSVRVVVTRGSGEMGLDPGLAAEPTVVIIALPLRGPPLSAYRSGVSVWPFGGPGGPSRGGDPAAKTGEHLFHVLAVREALAHDAQEALLVDRDGWVTEGASSNVFAVREWRAGDSAAAGRAPGRRDPGVRPRGRPPSRDPRPGAALATGRSGTRRRGLPHVDRPGGPARGPGRESSPWGPGPRAR